MGEWSSWNKTQHLCCPRAKEAWYYTRSKNIWFKSGYMIRYISHRYLNFDFNWKSAGFWVSQPSFFFQRFSLILPHFKIRRRMLNLHSNLNKNPKSSPNEVEHEHRNRFCHHVFSVKISYRTICTKCSGLNTIVIMPWVGCDSAFLFYFIYCSLL